MAMVSIKERPDAGENPELDSLDLTCPACDADLIADELFLAYRVCGACHRHFSIGARDRVALLVEAGSFEELNSAFAPPESTLARDRFPSAERLAEHHHLQVIGDAVVSGVGRLGGVRTVIVALDDHLVGSALGALMTEKIILALDYARASKHPVVLVCAGAAASGYPGPLAQVQGGRLATAFSQMHLEGVPVVGMLAHPVAGTVFATLAAHCDVLISEPGVLVSFDAAHDPTGRGIAPWQAVEALAADGWIDAIVDRSHLGPYAGTFVDVTSHDGGVRAGVASIPNSGVVVTAVEAMANLEQPRRPTGPELMASLVPRLVELRGDRVTGDSAAVVCGVGRLDGLSVAICTLHGAGDGDVPPPAAVTARKISRLARLAGRLELPLILLTSDPAREQPPPLTPEAAFAISSLSTVLAQLPVPVIAIGIGRVRGTLATALMMGDRQFLLSSALYDCAIAGDPVATRWPHAHGASAVASMLTARECDVLGLVDGIIDEPRAGAHIDPEGMTAAIRAAILGALAELTGTSQRRLLDTRHRRQRNLGQSTPEGLAAVHSELWQLQEWQRSVGKSLDDWRDRWDHFRRPQPRLSFQRPDVAELATRLRARRAELLERARHGDRSASQ